MGDETWASIQLVKSKRESFREKLKRRKAERDTILSVASGGSSPASTASLAFNLSPIGNASISGASSSGNAGGVAGCGTTSPNISAEPTKLLTSSDATSSNAKEVRGDLEHCLIEVLRDSVPPITVEQLLSNPRLAPPLDSLPVGSSASTLLANLLQKFAYKELISVGGSTVTSVQHARLTAALEHSRLLTTGGSTTSPTGPSVSPSGTTHTTPSTTTSAHHCEDTGGDGSKEERVSSGGLGPNKKLKTASSAVSEKDDVMSLLSAPSIRERENKRVGEEILELLNKPTAKEQSVAQHFRSQGGAKVREFCPRGTAEECTKWRGGRGNTRPWREAGSCGKLHFRKIIQHHTDETLGDCSFLNTCFHMDTCRYVHYEVDYSGMEELSSDSLSSPHQPPPSPNATSSTLNGATAADGTAAKPRGMLSPPRRTQDRTVLFPPQWIQCDLRFLDMAILGKFSVIMADPPWDIHMELPYGTMSDDEMRELNIPALQDEGLIFLWVTGRAMELGRECLTLWGYERVDEIIWVKTNQLQRIIRTGRTGHWLNHGKEHCLVGMKGKPKINRCMDCDVIVAEVRATSHKPDEIYGIIERLSPGTRKIELFGRHHNVQPNWLTLGNQLEGVNLLEDDLVRKFKEHHPDGVHASKD